MELQFRKVPTLPQHSQSYCTLLRYYFSLYNFICIWMFEPRFSLSPFCSCLRSFAFSFFYFYVYDMHLSQVLKIKNKKLTRGVVSETSNIRISTFPFQFYLLCCMQGFMTFISIWAHLYTSVFSTCVEVLYSPLLLLAFFF